jgi:TonB family protein
MKSFVPIVCGLLLACLPRLALAADPPRPSVITNPDWLQRPSGEDLADHYPEIAQRINMDGRATISCTVSTLGKLDDCTVISEAPRDMGFGRAVLAMADLFRMRPLTVDGQPAAGGTVRIPIRFVLPSAEDVGPLPKATSPRALALAQQLLEILKPAAAMETRYEEAAREIEFTIDEPVPDSTRAAAAEALRTAVKGRLPALKEAYAHAYAARFGEDHLAAMLAFFRGPAAPVLNHDAGLQALQEMVGREFQRRLLAEAHVEFCRRRPCEAQMAAVVGGSGDAIEAPIWVEEPSGAALLRATPGLASMLGVQGLAKLSCQVSAQGLLQQCRVAAETPGGLGFGQAALSLASGFRLAPALVAQAAAGKTVAVRVGFPAGEPPQSWEPPPPRSARALQLAKQLMDVEGELVRTQAALVEDLDELMGEPPAGADPAATKDAMASIQAAANSAITHYVEQVATVIASQFTEEQLAAAVAFRATPAGKALADNAPLAESLTKVTTAYAELIGEDARAHYCRAGGCPAPPATRAR